MHIAAYNRSHRCDISKFLLEKGVFINQVDKESRTPLHIADLKGSVELVDILVKKGIGVNKKDKFEKTALDYVSKKKRLAITNLIENKVFHTN